jgi:hypothetical protein
MACDLQVLAHWESELARCEQELALARLGPAQCETDVEPQGRVLMVGCVKVIGSLLLLSMGIILVRKRMLTSQAWPGLDDDAVVHKVVSKLDLLHTLRAAAAAKKQVVLFLYARHVRVCKTAAFRLGNHCRAEDKVTFVAADVDCAPELAMMVAVSMSLPVTVVFDPPASTGDDLPQMLEKAWMARGWDDHSMRKVKERLDAAKS